MIEKILCWLGWHYHRTVHIRGAYGWRARQRCKYCKEFADNSFRTGPDWRKTK